MIVLTLERRTQNRLSPDSLKGKLKDIVTFFNDNPTIAVTGSVGKVGEPEQVMSESGEPCWLYKAVVKIKPRSSATTDGAMKVAKRKIQDNLAAVAWQVTSVSGGEQVPPEESEPEAEPRPPFTVPELNGEVLSSYFSGIYEREHHIRLIHDSATAFAESVSRRAEVRRSHILLYGQPAGCKTTLFERFKQWYEDADTNDPPVERVAFVDGPTMSKAGLENWMLDKAKRNILPEIIVIEEVEKQSMDNLLSLVSLMGSGHISKMNARIGHRKETVNSVIWATCNDPGIIRSFRNGVLWSRFSHRYHCARPSRQLMHRILMDKVKQMDGNPRWVDAAIKFAYETIATVTGQPLDDPREVAGLLDGRDRLLSGQYQKDKLEIIVSEMQETESLKKLSEAG